MAKRSRSSEEIIDVGDTTTGRRSSGVEVVLKDKNVRGDLKKIYNLIIFFISMVIFISLALYICMSATLMNFTLSSNGKAAWNLYGVVPDKADSDSRYITASSNSVPPTDLLGRAGQSFMGVEDPFIGEVLSDRFDTVSSSHGKILVNGKDTGHKGKIKKKTLNQEYLVKCIEGECKKGNYFIVNKNNIVGNLYGYLSFGEGFEEAGAYYER